MRRKPILASAFALLLGVTLTEAQAQSQSEPFQGIAGETEVNATPPGERSSGPILGYSFEIDPDRETARPEETAQNRVGGSDFYRESIHSGRRKSKGTGLTIFDELFK